MDTMTLPPGTGNIDPPKDEHDWVFGFIPNLRNLLPKMKGIPGFKYAQICTSNLWKAQDQGWLEVDGTAIYIIRGPKGDATMKLYTMGKRIPGQAHDSGARVCLVDKDVEDVTGLEINGENDAAVNESEKTEVGGRSAAAGTEAPDTKSTGGKASAEESVESGTKAGKGKQD